MLFMIFTTETADKCTRKLTDYVKDVETFKKLTEAVLTLTIFLNRKRVGDVQHMKLEDYNSDTNTTNQNVWMRLLSVKLLCSNILSER